MQVNLWIPPSRDILSPALALIGWTFVMWFWLYATRLPAMRAARINPARIKRKSDLDPLPVAVQQVADNYNHLHEQPTIFYALVFYSYLAGVADGLNVGLAWAYVGIRIVHSLIQCTVNFVPVRFMVFSAGSLVLMVIAARNAVALFS
ncbi:MAG: MAPEG family protein [Steroidobacteraceae bacterium]